ncbi:hypothetical protein [Agreia sp. COWG]|uniref:hypothetical protein n=1 Tax=Agreia sp. COWG TaxID=2773266 RepID=UPI001927F7AF|nr:hypothetical protein [Agreia sp. COWG]
MVLGTTQATFQVVVNGWAAEVWLDYQAQDSKRQDRRDWSPYDFIGGLSLRSILFTAENRMREVGALVGVVPQIEVADQLFRTITQQDVNRMIPKIWTWSERGEPSNEEWWWKRIPSSGPILEEFTQITNGQATTGNSFIAGQMGAQ